MKIPVKRIFRNSFNGNFCCFFLRFYNTPPPQIFASNIFLKWFFKKEMRQNLFYLVCKFCSGLELNHLLCRYCYFFLGGRIDTGSFAFFVNGECSETYQCNLVSFGHCVGNCTYKSFEGFFCINFRESGLFCNSID